VVVLWVFSQASRQTLAGVAVGAVAAACHPESRPAVAPVAAARQDESLGEDEPQGGVAATWLP